MIVQKILRLLVFDLVGGRAPYGAFVRATTLGRPNNTRLPPMRGHPATPLCITMGQCSSLQKKAPRIAKRQ